MRVRAVVYLDVDPRVVASVFGVPDLADDTIADVLQDYAQALVEGDLAAKGVES